VSVAVSRRALRVFETTQQRVACANPTHPISHGPRVVGTSRTSIEPIPAASLNNQSPACAAPVTFELFADSGASQCSIIVPVQNAVEGTIWCPMPAFVLSLANGERYAIHFENDCSAGVVVKDPANPEVGAIFCPNTCAGMEQSAHSALQVVESCGGCVTPTE
jgi:hypothetical protein